jgi:hypothetical protein
VIRQPLSVDIDISTGVADVTIPSLQPSINFLFTWSFESYAQDSAWICRHYYKIERYITARSSRFPLVDRNLQTFTDIYTCPDAAFQKCTIRIYHDAKNISIILLPVL